MFSLVKGWNLLLNAEDWEAYKQQFAANQGWACAQVAWGAEPVKYPTMVVSYAPMYAKIVSCYFYIDEAKKLLRAAGGQLVRQVSELDQPAVEPPAESRSVQLVNTVGPNQAETNKHVAAMLLSLTQVMVEKSIIAADKFERKVQANTAAVEGFMTEHRAAVLSSVDQAQMLPKLLPDADSGA